MLAAAGITAFLGFSAASAPAVADLPARKLKPTLPIAATAGEQAHDARRREGIESASATQGRAVSFATRELDIRKLDANAFGDGEDVR